MLTHAWSSYFCIYLVFSIIKEYHKQISIEKQNVKWHNMSAQYGCEQTKCSELPMDIYYGTKHGINIMSNKTDIVSIN